MSRQYYVYILTNKFNTVCYIGVTDNLVRRMYEHKQKLVDGFTKMYNVSKLVYFDVFDDPQTAIEREKALKNLIRRKKNMLIDKLNIEWKDLYEDILK